MYFIACIVFQRFQQIVFERLGEMGPKILYSALIVSLFFVGSCTESTSSEISNKPAYYTQQSLETFGENLISYDPLAKQKDPGYAICDPDYPNPYNGPSITYADYRGGEPASGKVYTTCEGWSDESPQVDEYSHKF